MTFEQFRVAVFEEAERLGCQAAEVYYTKGESFSVNVLDGEMESYEAERGGGLSLRVKKNGRDGYAYTETMADPAGLAAHAADNADVIENMDDHPMQGKSEYCRVQAPPCRAKDMTEREKIDLAKRLEIAVKQADPRVLRVQRCVVASQKGEVRIYNTLGLDAEEKRELIVDYAMPILGENGEVKNAFAFRVGDKTLDVEGCAREAVEECAALLGASPVAAGSYKVVIRNDAMADLLAAFSSLFSADAAQKGLSLLKDKLGETVAAEGVTIVDDPFYRENPRAFDDEGVPCQTKNLVEHGVLKGFLHNLKTAKKAGVPSTGNAGRSPAGSLGVRPTNLYILPGEKTLPALLEEMGNGLLITEMDGLHAGLNPVSGEFSLIAKGRLIENGRDVRAVDQITVGGSFLTLMKAVRQVGGDLRFGIPGASCVGSPSVLVESLMVSGK